MIYTQSANALLQTHAFAQLLEMKEQAPDGYQHSTMGIKKLGINPPQPLRQPLPCSAVIRLPLDGSKSQ